MAQKLPANRLNFRGRKKIRHDFLQLKATDAMTKKETKMKRTKMEFDGDHKSNSLLIANFGDVEFFAKGVFDLSGMIFSKKTVEVTVIGTGNIRFHGFCKKLIIHPVKGECMLDLSALTTK